MDICAAATGAAHRLALEPAGRWSTTRATSTTTRCAPMAASGGVVCVTTWAPLIWDGQPGMPTLADWLRCLDHAVALVGIDHVGVSTDSMGTMGAYPAPRARPRCPALRLGDRRLRPAGPPARRPTTASRPISTGSRTSRGWSRRCAPTASATTTSASCSAATCCGCSTPPGSRAGSDEAGRRPVLGKSDAPDQWPEPARRWSCPRRPFPATITRCNPRYHPSRQSEDRMSDMDMGQNAPEAPRGGASPAQLHQGRDRGRGRGFHQRLPVPHVDCRASPPLPGAVERLISTHGQRPGAPGRRAEAGNAGHDPALQAGTHRHQARAATAPSAAPARCWSTTCRTTRARC